MTNKTIDPKEARLCGVHRQTWVKWERAERQPDSAARRLIHALVWMGNQGLLEEYLTTGGGV